MRHIDVYRLADEAKFNGFHRRVLLWCALIIVVDGYDLQLAGIALPAIMADMHVSAAKAGFMVSAALLGMTFGSILLGTLAERIGRRRTIAGCIALFSVCTAASGLTQQPVVFGVMRFLAGMGLGGVLPSVMAHMTEYAPRKLRATLVTLVFSGYASGGVLAAVLGKGLIEAHGWQSVFLAAGAPLLLLPWMLRSLPESLGFLLKTGRIEQAKAIAAALEPSYTPQVDDQLTAVTQSDENKGLLGQLFMQGRGLSTLMFWATMFLCLFVIYGLNTSLTKLMATAGHSMGSALTFVVALNIGAMIGAVGGGWLADRLPIKFVLCTMYGVAAVSITLLGTLIPAGAPISLLLLLIGLTGASTLGTQLLTLAYAGMFYPVDLRATGVGWAAGVGRCGAIFAPILMGVLLGMQLPLHQNFIAMAIPAGLAALTVTMISARARG